MSAACPLQATPGHPQHMILESGDWKFRALTLAAMDPQSASLCNLRIRMEWSHQVSGGFGTLIKGMIEENLVIESGGCVKCSHISWEVASRLSPACQLLVLIDCTAAVAHHESPCKNDAAYRGSTPRLPRSASLPSTRFTSSPVDPVPRDLPPFLPSDRKVSRTQAGGIDLLVRDLP